MKVRSCMASVLLAMVLCVFCGCTQSKEEIVKKAETAVGGKAVYCVDTSPSSKVCFTCKETVATVVILRDKDLFFADNYQVTGQYILNPNEIACVQK